MQKRRADSHIFVLVRDPEPLLGWWWRKNLLNYRGGDNDALPLPHVAGGPITSPSKAWLPAAFCRTSAGLGLQVEAGRSMWLPHTAPHCSSARGWSRSVSIPAGSISSVSRFWEPNKFWMSHMGIYGCHCKVACNCFCNAHFSKKVKQWKIYEM